MQSSGLRGYGTHGVQGESRRGDVYLGLGLGIGGMGTEITKTFDIASTDAGLTNDCSVKINL